jgi:hypothetical protein
VNRLFNLALIPLVYQELNLFHPNRVDHEVATRYGRYIRTLRAPLMIDGANPDEITLNKFLSFCSNLRSLGLYYHIGPSLPSSNRQPSLLPKILSFIQSGKLQEVGIYSPWGYSLSRGELEGGDQAMIRGVAKSDQAKLVKRLDVYYHTIPSELYSLIRTQFTGLQALTIRGPPRRLTPVRWDEHTQELPWGRYSSLTNLQLVSYHELHPCDVANLICHLSSLEYFLISSSSHGPPNSIERRAGWSSQGDGWWNRRKPLKKVHLEHLMAWKLLAMGTIPAVEVIAVSLYPGDLASAFTRDHEIFPYLQLLRTEPLSSATFDEGADRQIEDALDSLLVGVCDARKITFQRDASWVINTRFFDR